MSPYRKASLAPTCRHTWHGRFEEYEWSDDEYRYFDVRLIPECSRCGVPAPWWRSMLIHLAAILRLR